MTNARRLVAGCCRGCFSRRGVLVGACVPEPASNGQGRGSVALPTSDPGVPADWLSTITGRMEASSYRFNVQDAVLLAPNGSQGFRVEITSRPGIGGCSARPYGARRDGRHPTSLAIRRAPACPAPRLRSPNMAEGRP